MSQKTNGTSTAASGLFMQFNPTDAQPPSAQIDFSSITVAPGITTAMISGRDLNDDEVIEYHRNAIRFWVFDYAELLSNPDLHVLDAKVWERITANSGYSILLLVNFLPELIGRLIRPVMGTPSERFESGITEMYPQLAQPQYLSVRKKVENSMRNGFAHIGLPRDVLLSLDIPKSLTWNVGPATGNEIVVVNPVIFASHAISVYEGILQRIQHPKTLEDWALRKQAVARLRTMA